MNPSDEVNKEELKSDDLGTVVEEPKQEVSKALDMTDVRQAAYQFVNPYSGNKQMTKDVKIHPNTPIDLFYIPNAKHDKFYTFALSMEDPESKEAASIKVTPPEEQLHIVNMYGRGNVHTSNAEGEEVADEMVQNDTYYNTYEYANKNLGIREVKFKQKSSSEMKDSDVFRSFKSALGGSKVINVPLYHSGFRLLLTAPTVVELTSLQLQCVGEEVEIGRDTFCLSSNGRRSLTVETFKNFIATKIKDTTLDIDMANDDIFKYISINDLDTILLGLVQATYVNKIPVTRTCHNATEHNRMCDFAVTADLDPSKLLIVDRRFIDFEMIKTIGKSEPRSVSIAEQQNYVMMLNKAIDKIRGRQTEVKFQDGIFELQMPSIFDYCLDASAWVEKVNKEIDSLLDSATNISRTTAMESLTKASNITSYIANIKNIGIVLEDGSLKKAGEDNRMQLMSAIEAIASNDEINNELPFKIIEYVNKSFISIIATPNFVCPNCKKDQENVVSTKADFDAFIPLNMIDFFLRLVEWQRVLTMIHTKD